MHTTNAEPAHLLQAPALVRVNGKRCWLSLEPDCIAWRAEPAEQGSGSGSGSGSSGSRPLKAHDNLNDDKAAPTSRLEFSLIIGTEYGRSKQQQQQQQKKTDNGNYDEASGDPKNGDRVKIYYVKQNELKSRNRLLKLKKLIIERAPSKDARKRRRRQQHEDQSQEDQLSVDISRLGVRARSANDRLSPATAGPQPKRAASGGGSTAAASDPPSCYASEGSTGQLSSWSAAASASSSSCSQSSACSSPINRGSDQSGHGDQGPPSLAKIGQLIERRLELERNQAGRPRRMLVFVNPFGGKGKAVRLFRTKVRRLLALAQIDARLVVTKRANHARDTLEDPNFDVEQFDAIVCVGGDGMFSELMNGLLFRYNRDKLLAASQAFASSHLTGNQATGAPLEPIGGKSAASSSSGGSNSGGSSSTSSTSSASCSTFCDGGSLHDDGSANVDCERSSQSTCASAPRQPDSERTTTSSGSQASLDRLRAALGGIGQPLSRPALPIGIIGAGSTDANSFGLLGTNDTVTATLNIILGKQISIDVCSVHTIRDDRLLRFVSTFVAYGYFGDVVRESERLRWLGPSRYDVTGVNQLLRNRAYAGRVRILLASGRDGSPSDRDASGRCHTNCELCRRLGGESPVRDSELAFLERRGSFVGVNAAVTACRCPQTRKGFSPNNHLANGCVDLILVRPCTRLQYVQYLLRTGWTSKSAFDLKYVEAYRCRQFEFLTQHDDDDHHHHHNDHDDGDASSHYETADGAAKQIAAGASSSVSSSSSSAISSSSSSASAASNSNSLQSAASSSSSNRKNGGRGKRFNRPFSSWNVDGEILDQGSIRVKVNNQLLRVFGTGEPNRALRRPA